MTSHGVSLTGCVCFFQCFSCATCRNRLMPGDRFHYVNGAIFCEHDRPGGPMLSSHLQPLQSNPVLPDQKVKTPTAHPKIHSHQGWIQILLNVRCPWCQSSCPWLKNKKKSYRGVAPNQVTLQHVSDCAEAQLCQLGSFQWVSGSCRAPLLEEYGLFPVSVGEL